ncbi:MAG TPA: hypothetical protein VMM59_03880, partial [Thermohalobaculum sp.]|nr:hypothetical protein [Thermohalobaculum sp.]
MLKDDRMMGMLTFVVIMLAVGTMIQRADFFQRLFGTGDAEPVLVADEAMVQATQTVAVDVLANDSGIGPDAAGRLTIVAEPECGRAFVREGRVMYLGTEGCIGEQTVRYGLGSAEATAELRIVVRPASLGGASTRVQASGAASEAAAPQPAEAAPPTEDAAESRAAVGESAQGPDAREAEAAVGLARVE